MVCFVCCRCVGGSWSSSGRAWCLVRDQYLPGWQTWHRGSSSSSLPPWVSCWRGCTSWAPSCQSSPGKSLNHLLLFPNVALPHLPTTPSLPLSPSLSLSLLPSPSTLPSHYCPRPVPLNCPHIYFTVIFFFSLFFHWSNNFCSSIFLKPASHSLTVWSNIFFFFHFSFHSPSPTFFYG